MNEVALARNSFLRNVPMIARGLPVVALLFSAPVLWAGIIPGSLSAGVTSTGVSAQYTYDDITERGTVRIVGFANQLVLPDGSRQAIRRGVYNPGNLDPVHVELHPYGDFAETGVNIPHRFQVPSGQLPLFPAWGGVLKIDAKTDRDGNLMDGSLVIHGALSATDERVSLLNATLTDIDLKVFNSHGHLEALANVTQTHSSMPDIGPILGVKTYSYQRGLGFLRSFNFFRRASANQGRTVAVPEPSSVFAVGSVLVLGCCLRYRKRKRRVS